MQHGFTSNLNFFNRKTKRPRPALFLRPRARKIALYSLSAGSALRRPVVQTPRHPSRDAEYAGPTTTHKPERRPQLPGVQRPGIDSTSRLRIGRAVHLDDVCSQV